MSAHPQAPLTLVAEQGSLEPIPDVTAGERPKPAWLRYLGPVLALAVLALALMVLRDMVEDIHLSDVAAALRSATWVQIALAIAATALSFAALAAYDVLAVRSCIKEPVGLGTALFAGATGYAVSNALGFPVLTGGSVRYRIYSAIGLGVADIGRIVAIAWLTLLLGLVFVVGLAMALEPAGIATLTRLSTGAARGIGLALVAGILVFLAWVTTGERCLCFRGWSIPMPNGPTAVGQLIAGSVDFAAAAATLYVLLPAGVAPDPGAFLVVFAVAIGLGIVAHTPGGIGVFEATIAAGLGMTERPDLVAALILYRVIYSLLPLAVAAVALLGVELIRRHTAVAAGRRLLNRMLQGVVPSVAGGLVLAGGVVLLVSSSIPRQAWRIDLLYDLVPLPFVEASNLLGSLVGVLLMVIARGLFARLAPAWWAAVTLLGVGVVFSMIKGVDWEEAVILLAFIGFLAFFKDLFYRPGHLGDLRPGLRWLSLVLGLLIVVAWVGFFLYRHVEYSNDLLVGVCLGEQCPTLPARRTGGGDRRRHRSGRCLVQSPPARAPGARAHARGHPPTGRAGAARPGLPGLSGGQALPGYGNRTRLHHVRGLRADLGRPGRGHGRRRRRPGADLALPGTGGSTRRAGGLLRREHRGSAALPGHGARPAQNRRGRPGRSEGFLPPGAGAPGDALCGPPRDQGGPGIRRYSQG